MISLNSPVRTRAQDWPAGAKMAGLALATTALFALPGLAVQAAGFGLVLALYALPGRVFLAHGLRQLRVLWPFVLVLLVWHGLTGDLAQGALLVLRIGSTVALANLVTMTTTLAQMTDALNTLLGPLRRLGLPVGLLGAAIPLVIRFVPAMTAKGRALLMAWRARSSRRPTWRLVLPLMLLALDDADHLAEALRARGGLLPPDD